MPITNTNNKDINKSPTKDITDTPQPRIDDNDDSAYYVSENIESKAETNNGLLMTSGSDDILTKKVTLVNNAINQIGFTPYHWKLFCLNGMGYAVDSLLLSLHSVCQNQIAAEYLYKDNFNAYVTGNCKY